MTNKMTEKKYELIRKSNSSDIEFKYPNLYRIKALKDIPRFNVKAGDIGGYVEHNYNLSQNNDCWIGNDAVVTGNAEVYGCAYVYDSAEIYGTANIYDGARVHGHASIGENATIFENAEVSGSANVLGDAIICGDAKVSNGRIEGNVCIQGNAVVSGLGYITDYVQVYGDAQLINFGTISGHVRIYDHALIDGDHIYCHGYARIHSDAKLYDEAYIIGESEIGECAVIKSYNDCMFLVLNMLGPNKMTIYKTRDGAMVVCNGHYAEFKNIDNIISDHYKNIRDGIKTLVEDQMLNGGDE